jgi:hypothetical protein
MKSTCKRHFNLVRLPKQGAFNTCGAQGLNEPEQETLPDISNPSRQQETGIDPKRLSRIDATVLQHVLHLNDRQGRSH